MKQQTWVSQPESFRGFCSTTVHCLAQSFKQPSSLCFQSVIRLHEAVRQLMDNFNVDALTRALTRQPQNPLCFIVFRMVAVVFLIFLRLSQFLAIARDPGHLQVPGQVEMVPSSLLELPKSSRTPGKSKTPEFLSPIFSEQIRKIQRKFLIGLINPFFGGAPRGDGPSQGGLSRGTNHIPVSNNQKYDARA